jgi:hypothetical protein
VKAKKKKKEGIIEVRFCCGGKSKTTEMKTKINCRR